MKTHIFKSSLLLMFLFNFSIANAVAPRITQDMFGQEVSADILAYESIETNDSQVTDITVEIVKQAFAIEETLLNIDVVPSTQLAIYALFNGDVLALIGNESDLTAFDKSQYFCSVFYIHDNATQKIPFALYIDKNAPNAEKLFTSFEQGLLKLLENQTYSDIIQSKSGKVEPINYKELLNEYHQGC